MKNNTTKCGLRKKTAAFFVCRELGFAFWIKLCRCGIFPWQRRGKLYRGMVINRSLYLQILELVFSLTAHPRYNIAAPKSYIPDCKNNSLRSTSTHLSSLYIVLLHSKNTPCPPSRSQSCPQVALPHFTKSRVSPLQVEERRALIERSHFSYWNGVIF